MNEIILKIEENTNKPYFKKGDRISK